MKNITIAVIAMGLTLSCCDEIKDPLKDEYGFIDLPETNKTVLIEEFTGTSCTFCPNGARKIQGYIDANPENVVTVAMHASGFAIPNPSTPYDFRSDDGEELYTFMGSGGLPGGMFDRGGYPNDVFKNPADWDGLLIARLAEPASFSLQSELEIDTANKTFNLNTQVFGIQSLTDSDPIHLVAYLVEDSIVAPQLDNGVIVDDYVHNHVFRKSFTGVQGNMISANGFEESQRVTRNLNISVTDSTWNVWNTSKISAVVFVLNASTQEVYQAQHAGLH